jgi:hypothetical protein
MTAVAWIKSADLKRMAAIATEQNVTVEVTEAGRTIRVAPAASATPSQNQLAPRGGVRL